MESQLDAVVVGAGIAGLAAAHELQAAGAEVLVLDPSDRPGGVMRTDHHAGFVFENGPNTAVVKPPMRHFLERLQLVDELRPAAPVSKRRFLYRDGQLVEVPGSAWAFARSPLLSARAKWRLLAEPFQRRGSGRRESVAEFVGRRLGREVSDALVGPFLTGVYAGDERELGAWAVFPGLVEAEERHGSLLVGGLAGARRGRRERGLPGSRAPSSGFGPLARRLAEGLAEPPALGSRAELIARDGSGFRIDVASRSGPLHLAAERVVIATPSYAAGPLLRGLDGDVADALEAIHYAPLVVAPVGVRVGAAPSRVEGFGFLVPRDQKLGLLGCLFMSQLFPHRAPEGSELLHCMLGGVRWPDAIHQPDDALERRLGDELEQTLGLKDAPAPLRWVRWPRAVPQPGRNHAELVEWLDRRLAQIPGLALAGSYLAGVGVPDALASGVAAAARVLASRPAAVGG